MSQTDITAAIESERRRLAQLLDDDVIASLELIQAQTQTYLMALRGNQEAHLSLTVLHSLMQQTIQKARYVQSNLHPTVLETLGLEPALETLAADANRMRGLTIRLTILRLRERLPADVEVLLFRAIQMLINTASTHAHAAHFDIRLTQANQQVTLSYEDNGIWQAHHIRLVQTLQMTLQAVHGRMEIQIEEGHLLVKIQVRITEQVSLTPRETDIMQLVAEGLTNKEIASALHVSARTVNFHLDNVYSKLQVSTRTEAVMVALQQGWIQNPVK
jgi:DNA-binding CsgD family transcriptional regulator/glucose-6-phosphate-specific signal transduction histidine kinase